MQVLIVDEAHEAKMAMTLAFMDAGFQVVSAETVAIALAYVKTRPIDIVVLRERIGGRLSHLVALSAEYYNPQVITLMLTPRNDADVDELFSLIPSLYCLLAPDVRPRWAAQLARGAVTGSQIRTSRVAGRAPAFLSHRAAAAGRGAAVRVA